MKVCRRHERFWVLVSDTFGDFIAGTVNNELLEDNADLPLGQPILIERRHVYDVILIHAGEGEGATQ